MDISRSNKKFARIAQNFIAFLLVVQLVLSQNTHHSLTTAVYGGTFGDNFQRSFSNSVVNLAQADLQNLIGDRHNGANALLNGGEGSAGHVFEHALLGCLAGSALGGSCEASAAAISALYAGAVDPQQASDSAALFTANAALLGGLGAALAFGGDNNATMIASGIAGSAFGNNYLTHAQWEQLAADIRACMGDTDCESLIRASYAALSARQNEEYFACIAANDMACIIRVRDELAVVAMNNDSIQETLIALNTSLGGGLAPWSGLLNQDQVAVSATEIVYGDGNRITPQQAQEIFAIDRALLCTGGMSTGDCLAAIATARNERGIEGTLLIADMIPFVGTGRGLAECVAELSVSTCGGALLSVVPGAGGVVKVILKKGDEFVEFTSDGKKILSQKRGTTGDWNKDLNNPQPNKVYPLDNGDVYVTDDLGRVSTVKAELSHDPNARNGYQQRIAGGECRLPSDCGGHLIAAVFGGAGEAINLVPMDRSLNGVGGKWYELEKQWLGALGAGKNVKVDIQPVYSGNSKRPDSFVVKYEVDGNLIPQQTIFNTPTGLPE